MQILAQLALIALCLLMFRVERKYKLAILLLSAICFNCVTIPFIPFGNARYILCICFILSELKHLKWHIGKIKKTILNSLILSVCVATIILAINSPHYDNLMQYTRLVLLELITKYFVICYSFLSIQKNQDLRPCLQVSYYGLLILSAFAILNYITKHAIFIDEMLKGMELTDVMADAGSKFTFSERFRVQAMFFNPFDYGYICILLLLFNWYGYMKSFITKKRFSIIIGCCIFGIITCGCRTIILCCLVGVFVYMLFAFNLRKKTKYFVICSLCGIILFSSIPLLQEKFDEILSIFDKNSSVSGSSIEMRILQYTAVLYHIRNHLLFGRGLDFFNIDMGWGEGKQFLVDKDLFGLEGVIMSYLLERGFIGVCFYLFFYGYLFLFFIKQKHKDRMVSALCVASIVTYFSFANMTGELSSSFPTLLILGYGVRLLYNKINGQSIENSSFSFKSNDPKD